MPVAIAIISKFTGIYHLITNYSNQMETNQTPKYLEELKAFNEKYGDEADPNYFSFARLCEDKMYELIRGRIEFAKKYSYEHLNVIYKICCARGDENSILLFSGTNLARFVLVDGMIEAAVNRNSQTVYWTRLFSNRFSNIFEEVQEKLMETNPDAAEWLKTACYE